MSKLKAFNMPRYAGQFTLHEVYLKSEADKVIAEKDEEIYNIKYSRDEWAKACNQKDKEITELKQKLEDAKATHYAGSVDAGMRERRLKRALWLTRAEWARSSALSYHLIESHPDKDVAATYKRKANKWEKAKDKCLKKAEEYK